METFRKFVTGWAGKGLLVIFTVPFALFGMNQYFSQSGTTQATHLVNGEAISKEDLDAQIKSLQDRLLAQLGGDTTLINQTFVEQQATNNLINRRLILQQAEKLGLFLSVAQIEQMLRQNPEFQENGVFSPERYANYLRQRNLTNVEFVQVVRQDQVIRMLFSGIGGALINGQDLQQLINLLGEQRHLYMASVPLTEYQKEAQVTESEIQTYYEQHKAQFTQLAQADVSFVVLKPEQLLTEIPSITDAELQQAYQDYIKKLAPKVKHILITTTGRSDEEAKKRADEAYAKIKAGESFASVAKVYSEDTDSKDQEGLIKDYQPSTVSENFDRAVKAGGVSQPIKTQFGYHIVSSEPSNPPSFDSLKAQLTTQLQKRKAEIALGERINKINEDIVDNDNLETVTQDVKDAEVQKVHFTASQNHAILSQSVVKNRIFAKENQTDQHASGAIQLPSGEVVWFKVSNYIPAGVQAFDKVKEQAKVLALNAKAVELAKTKLEKTLSNFQTQPAEKVIAESNLKFENAGLVVRNRIPKPVENVAFSLPAPKAGQWSVGTVVLGNELLVVGVSEVKLASPLTVEEKQQLQQIYQQHYANNDINDYTAYLKSIAKIKDKQADKK